MRCAPSTTPPTIPISMTANPPTNGANSANSANRTPDCNRYAYAPQLSAINRGICNAPLLGSDDHLKVAFPRHRR